MKKLLPMIVLCTLLLSACIPAAFVVGATAGGMVISDRRNLETMVQDKKITCKALLRLNNDPRLKDCSHICVAAFNQVVLLVGETEIPEARVRAYELVKTIPHVRRISNGILIGSPINNKQRSLDTWITTKVKAALLAEKGLNSTQIKVITENNVVYLLGLVSHQQAEITTEVVRQVAGVKKVVTLFEYIN